jgi:hypothetical protein
MSSPRLPKPPDHAPEDIGTGVDDDKVTSAVRDVFSTLRITAIILLGAAALCAAGWALTTFSLLWDYPFAD